MRFRFDTPLALAAVATLALALVHAAPAAAQSTGDEVVSVVPSNVESDQAGVELHLIAADGAFFGQAAGRAPELHVGDGLRVVEFVVVSPKMARAVVDVDEFAFGAIPMQVWVYGLDGETVVLLAETSLGVIGPVGQGVLTLSVSENRQLIPEITEPQQAGDIFVSGPIVGTFSLAAPQGTSYSAAAPPSVVSDTPGVSISNMNVSTDASTFTFTVENPDTTPADIRIEQLNLDLSTFGASGGESGELAFGLSTLLLPGQSIPISSAHTPGRTISNPGPELVGSGESSDDPPPTDEEPGDSDGQEGESDGEANEDETSPPPVTGSGGGVSSGFNTPRSSSSGTSSSGSSSRRDSTGNQQGSSTQGGGRGQASPRQQQRPSRGNVRGQQQQRRGGGGARGGRGASADGDSRRAGRRGGGGGGGGGSSDGQRGSSNRLDRGGSSNNTPGRGSDRSSPLDIVPPPAVETEEGPEASGRVIDEDGDLFAAVEVFRFTVCDERFRPLPALGFQPAGTNGEANDRLVAQVWLELVFESDPTPGQQSELTIEITVPGTEPKRVRLYETSPDSGIFRSGPEGAELTLSRPTVR